MSRSDSRNDIAEAQLEYEHELEALKRQYRKMKNVKKSLKVETNNILRRQEREIEKMNMENEEMNALLNFSQSRYNKEFDKQNVKKLNQLLEKNIFVKETSVEGDQILGKLDKRIIATEEEVIKKKISNKKMPFLDPFAIQRRIRIMENRVYAANVKLVDLL